MEDVPEKWKEEMPCLYLEKEGSILTLQSLEWDRILGETVKRMLSKSDLWELKRGAQKKSHATLV